MSRRNKFSLFKEENNSFFSSIFSCYYKYDINIKNKPTIVISKKIGKASIRNRIRRQFKEALRVHGIFFPILIFVKIIPKNQIDNILTWKNILYYIEKLKKHINKLKQSFDSNTVKSLNEIKN